MADILIYRMKMPTDEPLRLVLNPNGQLFVDHGVSFTEYEAVELPDHGDLIDRDAKELLEKAHKEFIEEASKNRAVKYEQEVKSMRDFVLKLRDEAKEIKNGNVPFPERSGK